MTPPFRHSLNLTSCQSIGACVILLVAAIIRGRKIRTTRIRAQRLTLACAYFDEHGQLMVTQDGLLPSEKITNHYVEKVSPRQDSLDCD
jgi:hypothetical protein